MKSDSCSGCNCTDRFLEFWKFWGRRGQPLAGTSDSFLIFTEGGLFCVASL